MCVFFYHLIFKPILPNTINEFYNSKIRYYKMYENVHRNKLLSSFFEMKPHCATFAKN